MALTAGAGQMTCSLRAHAPGSGGLNRGRAYAALVCGRLLGEWHDAAPAGRYSARAMVIAARGTHTPAIVSNAAACRAIPPPTGLLLPGVPFRLIGRS